MLTQERLKELLNYNAGNGVFTWLVDRCRGRRHTQTFIKAGAVAGTIVAEGYCSIMIDGRNYLCHRLAVLYMTGKFPGRDIDHCDLDRSNNAWKNLREATRSQNNANSTARRDNKLGIKGVRINRYGRYLASITINKKFVHLGSFFTVEEASAAYARAAYRAYGEFARVA